MAFLAARQYATEVARKQQSQREVHFSRYAVLAGGTVLASTSGYLLYLLSTVFQGETCVWCLTSASLSFGVFFSALRGFTMRYWSCRAVHPLSVATIGPALLTLEACILAMQDGLQECSGGSCPASILVSSAACKEPSGNQG